MHAYAYSDFDALILMLNVQGMPIQSSFTKSLDVLKTSHTLTVPLERSQQLSKAVRFLGALKPLSQFNNFLQHGYQCCAILSAQQGMPAVSDCGLQHVPALECEL